MSDEVVEQITKNPLPENKSATKDLKKVAAGKKLAEYNKKAKEALAREMKREGETSTEETETSQSQAWMPELSLQLFYSSRSEVTTRIVFGLITWFAGPGKSSREFVYIDIYIFIYIYIYLYIYIYIFKVYVRGHVTYPPRFRVHPVLSS